MAINDWLQTFHKLVIGTHLSICFTIALLRLEDHNGKHGQEEFHLCKLLIIQYGSSVNSFAWKAHVSISRNKLWQVISSIPLKDISSSF